MKEKIIIVMPAYNAEKTLERTIRDIPKDSYDEIVLVDDASHDATVRMAHDLGLTVIVHPKNRGYGGNQKTCYRTALEKGADIVVMLHPDYQYDPTAIPRIVEPLIRGDADMVIASRFFDKNPYRQGMPLYKYLANRLLTFCQNIIFRQRISEYHSGYRAYTRNLLQTIPFDTFSENFVFDSQMLAEAAGRGFRLTEIGIPTRYFAEASQTSFRQSLRYGISTLGSLFHFITTYRSQAFATMLAVLAIASALTWSLYYPQGRPLGGDALEFHSLAISIKDRGEFGGGEWFAKENPSMWREPGYPAFLAVLYASTGTDLTPLLATQSILFGLSAALLFLALLPLLSAPLAGTASIVYALHPAIALRAGYVGSDLFFTIMIVCVAWIASRYPIGKKQAVFLGLAIGIASLIRTIGILLPLAYIGYLAYATLPTTQKLRLMVLTVGTFLLIITPWMIRNQVLFREFALTNRSGLMLHSRSAPLTASGRDYAAFVSSSLMGDYVTRKIFPDYSLEKARLLSGLQSRDLELHLLTNEQVPPSIIDQKLKAEGLEVIKKHPVRYVTDTIPWLARLNAPMIPRGSAQALFVTSQKNLPEALKLLIILSIRGTMYLFLATILYAMARTIRATSPWQLYGLLVIILNLGYAAFAPVERFSMPLYPLYIPFALEGIRLLYTTYREKFVRVAR